MSSFIHLQRRHASHSRETPLLGKKLLPRNLASKSGIHLLAAKLGHGTDSLTSPPKEGMLRIIRTPEKIQRLRPGSKPRTRVPEASMLTTRPPKPLKWKEYLDYLKNNKLPKTESAALG